MLKSKPLNIPEIVLGESGCGGSKFLEFGVIVKLAMKWKHSHPIGIFDFIEKDGSCGMF
jgi:hypothetical protein